MNPGDQQVKSGGTGLSSVLAQIALLHENDQQRPKRKTFRSWIEGHPGLIAELDAAVNQRGLERVYWCEHKTGWRCVKLVYAVRGPAPQVDAFVADVRDWVRRLCETRA